MVSTGVEYYDGAEAWVGQTSLTYISSNETVNLF
jgi:hypothetical protein